MLSRAACMTARLHCPLDLQMHFGAGEGAVETAHESVGGAVSRAEVPEYGHGDALLGVIADRVEEAGPQVSVEVADSNAAKIRARIPLAVACWAGKARVGHRYFGKEAFPDDERNLLAVSSNAAAVGYVPVSGQLA